MDRVKITRDDQEGMVREIAKQAKELYQDRHGKRNPVTLSKQELDDITTEAGKRVQDKRKGRLIP
ncbi:hypothetical protein LCGC14_0599010 [marine sediment metagenome]|uniref:Uncharacterized protein n=1 Tax=marine sediment metagenome TaxID=412755 RepID=A0A0F9UJQ7_9ZZZZ